MNRGMVLLLSCSFLLVPLVEAEIVRMKCPNGMSVTYDDESVTAMEVEGQLCKEEPEPITPPAGGGGFIIEDSLYESQQEQAKIIASMENPKTGEISSVNILPALKAIGYALLFIGGIWLVIYLRKLTDGGNKDVDGNTKHM